MEVQMTTSAPLPAARLALRRALMIGCALGTFCLGAGEAGAQAFDANPTTIAGTVSYNRATTGIETIQVESNTAIIRWSPGGGTFLPAGNTATFTNGPNNSDFVVLNRIISDAAIRFDGTVLSRIQNFALGTTRTGGTVIFSSPGGIIVGATAMFDVGSLVLTSLNVVDDGTGNFYDPATRGFTFAPFGGFPGGSVVTEAGSQISALEQSSFVAMVSPVIQHGGSVRVNGSAAYIAGESVQMRVNQGLFDIIVDVGSDDAVPLSHVGTTGGPASGAADDIHAIYLVAIPKNQAITAVLEGDIGFDPAVVAGVENGVIILSAGANVVGGAVDRYGNLSGTPAADLDASFQIMGGIVRSDLFGTARTDITAGPSTPPSLDFLQDVSLFGGRTAALSVGAGQILNVQGNALVSAAAFDSIDPAALDLTGGTARIFAQDGGFIHIFGTAVVDASARGLLGSVGNGGSGTGGNADVSAAVGDIVIDGALAIRANGEGGGDPVAPGPIGGAGTGGNAGLVASAGGTVVAKGGVAINADGAGSAADGSGGVNGAAGRGGTVLVAADSGGILNLAGALKASASGQGAAVQSGVGLTGGLGLGGAVTVRSAGTLNFNGDAAFAAAGTGGAAPSGGRGQGGNLLIEAAGGTIDFFGTASAAANGQGGGAAGAPGGPGGVGQGGTIQVLARSGAVPSRIGGGALDLTASGVGGAGGGAVAGGGAGTGGLGSGGAVSLLAESGNGTIALGAVQAEATGTGGTGGNADNNNDGGRGGTGTGGTVLAGTAAGPAATTPTGSATFASLGLGVGGAGGTGGFGRGTGGGGQGGSATVSATGAPAILLGPLALTANGTAGAGGGSPSAGAGAVGQATGGNLNVGAFAHAQSGIAGTLTLSDVTGSASALGTGIGNAAGQWHLSAIGGNVGATNVNLTATAAGTGPGPAPASTIDAQGRVVTLSGVSTLTTDGDILLTATGAGRVAGGQISLVSGQDVVVAHNGSAANGLTVDVTDLFIRARDDVTVNAGAVTRASNFTDIRAVDLATIAGRVIGRQINIGSADIDVQATGAIGDAATALVVLEVAGGSTPPGVPAQPTTLGGATQGPGYTLTGAEAGRIRADTLRIAVPALGTNPARAPDLVVRDLALNGGGAAAGIGRLEILTAGIARVEGNLLLAGARAQDGINFAATERLEIATPAGSVRVRDAGGAPGGTMRLASNNLWVASAAIIDALRANPNYAGRDGALRDNGGTEVPRGYVEANGITLVSGGTLYVQNTGSIQQFTMDFAGITVGSGGLTITAAAPNTNVTAFGRRLNADGSFTTGDAFFFQSTYNTAGGAGATGSYTPAAALNTCIIVTGQCGARPPAVPVPGGADAITGPFGDSIGDSTDGSTGGSSGVLSAAGGGLNDLVDSSFAADPLIEEPVTSGGEAGLWDCDPDHDGDCDDE
jgi:filamentous hemagglutinin family protein